MKELVYFIIGCSPIIIIAIVIGIHELYQKYIGLVNRVDELDKFATECIKDQSTKIVWRPITDIPTEHWKKNNAISPEYIVLCEGHCGTDNDLPVLGRACYSFATGKWMDCYDNISDHASVRVIAWTEWKNI